MDTRGRIDDNAPARRGTGAAPRRRHMGVATSDPQYLPTTGANASRPAPHAPAHPVSEHRAPLHYDRYLETPKPRRAIFSTRRERSRRRARLVILLLAVLALVLALVWFFILR